MATSILIYLLTDHEHQVTSTTSLNREWIHVLSIPRADITRFTLRPLKWLRFATFTVCGAKGDFSTTPGGETVDYENDSFDTLSNQYYYTPTSPYRFVDLQALNDQCTSSEVTDRRQGFREDIRGRDKSCIITGTDLACDAAHIIPHSKGSGYISVVVRDRASLYEQLPFSPAASDGVDINCIQNGMFLRKDLHGLFALGDIAFLKTPNFAMRPTDVPQVEQDPIPENRTTLQYIVPPTGLYSVPQCDTRADWSGDEAPPSILFDFMYGAAIAERWKSDYLHEILERRFENDFKNVPDIASEPPNLEEEEEEPETEPDDPNDPSWVPYRGKRKQRRTFSSDASAGLLDAMDDVLLLSMLVKGTTPRRMAAEWEKQNREKEIRSQEHSAEKVQHWLKSNVPVGDV